MALSATARNSTNPIISIAIVILGLVFGFFFYTQVLKGDSLIIPPPTIPESDTLARFQNINFDFSIFDNERFKSLKIYGESPVQPGTTGKNDLFAP